MAILPIIAAPNPILKKHCTPIAKVDGRICRLMDDMLETMYSAPGVGLAAPQVGELIRLIVVDSTAKDEKKDPHCLVNPELAWVSHEDATHEEGCLSLPDHYADVVRPSAIRVRYLDRDGKAAEMAAEGLLATCIQHEMDHLEGILFVDHISALRRNMILRKLRKAKRQSQPLASYATT